MQPRSLRRTLASPLARSAPFTFATLAAFAVSLSACELPPSTPADLGPSEPVVEYVAHQEILTPLPMRVRLPARYGADRILVFVRLWGARDWSTFELARDGQTWEGAVSCRAVSTVTGDTKYFFVALDARGEPVVGSGSPEWPHVATVVRELPDGPQGLPGQAPPDRCFDPADCPSDFAGCPSYTAIRPSCHADADCAGAGRCAWDGYCEVTSEPGIGQETEAELLAAALRKALPHTRIARAGLSTPRQ